MSEFLPKKKARTLIVLAERAESGARMVADSLRQMQAIAHESDKDAFMAGLGVQLREAEKWCACQAKLTQAIAARIRGEQLDPLSADELEQFISALEKE